MHEVMQTCVMSSPFPLSGVMRLSWSQNDNNHLRTNGAREGRKESSRSRASEEQIDAVEPVNTATHPGVDFLGEKIIDELSKRG